MNDLKKFLLDYLTEARKVYHTPGARKPVKDQYEVIVSVLEMVLVAVNKLEKGETNMEGIKLGLGKIGKIEEIQVPKRGLDAAIMELAKMVPPGHKEEIDPSATKWVSFRNRVYHLRKTAELPKTFKPLKAGDKFYLIQTMTEEPNRRGKR